MIQFQTDIISLLCWFSPSLCQHLAFRCWPEMDCGIVLTCVVFFGMPFPFIRLGWSTVGRTVGALSHTISIQQKSNNGTFYNTIFTVLSLSLRSIKPTDNKMIATFTHGEGYHNYHHVFPWDYKTSEYGNYTSNYSSVFIDSCAKIGILYCSNE